MFERSRVNVVNPRDCRGGVHPGWTCAVAGERLWANLENLGVLAGHVHLESSAAIIPAIDAALLPSFRKI